MAYKPATDIVALGETFYTPVEPAEFPKTVLRYRDNVAAAQVGLEGLSDTEWVEHFGIFAPLKGSLQKPLALKYHGHQFRHYNPDIGDGRGFLFAQLRDDTNRLLDLGTKGSGQTPFSRQGDGRLTLLGGVREVLASRYLEHMGVNTSRNLSLIETGEPLHRHDEPSPTRSVVLVRLSHSHIRFGTFQRQAFFESRDGLEALTAYCQTHFYPDTDTVPEFLSHVVQASAQTVASWMAGGFVHGVMNTDNMNITGETFDFGPYRFLPTLKSGYTAAYFDHNGLYCFARQPEAMLWNLGQLGVALSLICDEADIKTALEPFADIYKRAFRDAVFKRFGIEIGALDADIQLVLKTFEYLEASQANWPQFWHDWEGGAARATKAQQSPNADVYKGAAFEDWLTRLKPYTATRHGQESDAPARLLYEDITALWEPISKDDDWSLFDKKCQSFERCA